MDYPKAEVLMQIMIHQSLVLLHFTLLHFMPSRVGAAASCKTWTVHMVESVYYSISYQLLVTVASDYLWLVVLLLPVICVALLSCSDKSDKGQRLDVDASVCRDSRFRLTCITWTRGVLFLSTGLCILAADFREIFPKRFGKKRTYGVSLMDTGVGWYLVVQSMTRSSAMSNDEKQVEWGQDQGSVRPRCSQLAKWFRHTFSLLLLGILRQVAVKYTDYSTPVGEYGVHWNFFYTLFTLKVFLSLLQKLPARMYTVALFLVGCSFPMVAESLMSVEDIRNYLIDPLNRGTLIGANREGLFSLLGYCSIMCFATLKMRLLLLPHLAKESALPRGKLRLFFKFLLVALTYFLVLLASEKYLDEVSRRFANCSYVFWTLFFTSSAISAFLGLEVLFDRFKCPPTWPTFFSTVADFGLVHFLIANVSTGVLNQVFKPKEMKNQLLCELILGSHIILTNLFTYLIANSRFSTLRLDSPRKLQNFACLPQQIK